MSGNNNSKENQDRQFDEEQYQMLLRCSKINDITEWNEWRSKNPFAPIMLENSNLRKAYLKGANLTGANLKDAILNAANLTDSILHEVRFDGAELVATNFTKAKSTEVVFDKARMVRVIFNEAEILDSSFKGTKIGSSEIKKAYINECNFKNANLVRADLSNSHFEECNFENSLFQRADLNSAEFHKSNMKGANFEGVAVGGKTLLWDCSINDQTDFTGVGLDSARIEPKLKERLKFNIRRKQWRKWYEDNKIKRWPMNLFWKLSDYGGSTKRILERFALLAAVFTLIYYFWGIYDIIWDGSRENPGIIDQLFIMESNSFDFLTYLTFYIRAIYFSVVTMTTLGFGDMYAMSKSIPGHVLLTMQVLLGYIILGALVTRFGILFMSSGPMLELKKDKEKTKPIKPENKEDE
ncbi:MAG: pentapeptide repeat-containing protein [Candidatus Desulfatibia sp.]|uniref:pentapeptide repeat-containing protein n=1 Tax=Candidatus Desulfatibia sp. TaxID=3101189 RepID=UPI002F2C527A